jgi:hypothetical protein
MHTPSGCFAKSGTARFFGVWVADTIWQPGLAHTIFKVMK